MQNLISVREQADLCFDALKQGGHFKGCGGAWEAKQIETTIQLQTTPRDKEILRWKVESELWREESVKKDDLLEKMAHILYHMDQNISISALGRLYKTGGQSYKDAIKELLIQRRKV